MKEIRCDFADLGDALARAMVGQLERDVAVIANEVLRWTGADLINEAKRLTVKVDAIYRGTMIDSWGMTPTKLGVLVGNTAPHASAIEYGRLPGPVNEADIIEWARVKLFGLPPRRDRSALPGPSNRVIFKPALRLRYKRVGVSRAERAAMKQYRDRLKNDAQGLEAEAYQAGLRIAASIEKNGTEPRFILRDAMKIVPKRLRFYVKRHLPAEEVPF